MYKPENWPILAQKMGPFLRLKFLRLKLSVTSFGKVYESLNNVHQEPDVKNEQSEIFKKMF